MSLALKALNSFLPTSKQYYFGLHVYFMYAHLLPRQLLSGFLNIFSLERVTLF